jgi:hypothetical protein
MHRKVYGETRFGKVLSGGGKDPNQTTTSSSESILPIMARRRADLGFTGAPRRILVDYTTTSPLANCRRGCKAESQGLSKILQHSTIESFFFAVETSGDSHSSSIASTNRNRNFCPMLSMPDTTLTNRRPEETEVPILPEHPLGLDLDRRQKVVQVLAWTQKNCEIP